MANKGHIPWNKDKTLSEEHKRKISESLKGKTKSEEHKKKMYSFPKGKGHPNWRGDKVSYHALHEWLRVNKPKTELCEICGEKRRLDWANIKKHVYTRNIEDYKCMCRSCHKKMDLGWTKWRETLQMALEDK